VQPDVVDLLAQVGGTVGHVGGVFRQHGFGQRPPCDNLVLAGVAFSARTVTTITAASGRSPEARHLMLKNRSAPMSAPNPASVTR